MNNELLQQIWEKINSIEARLDVLETATYGSDDLDEIIDLAQIEYENEIQQHNEIM